MLHPPWAVFHARLLDNQEGVNTERFVYGKLSAISNADLCGPDTILTIVGDINHGESNHGDVKYTVVYRIRSLFVAERLGHIDKKLASIHTNPGYFRTPSTRAYLRPKYPSYCLGEAIGNQL